jgi:pimeloyl-ACP methyl ester carboxylesterase
VPRALDVALLAPERVTALVLLSPGLSGHRWPDEMLAAARELVHAAVPADRLDDYRHRRAARVRPEDVAAMAEAQARFMVAGPRRQPGDVDPRVWEAALVMLRGVFQRLWRGPPSTELELDPRPWAGCRRYACRPCWSTASRTCPGCRTWPA